MLAFLIYLQSFIVIEVKDVSIRSTVAQYYKHVYSFSVSLMYDKF